MRSDEERDRSIDLLMAKVQALEEEVARLKGQPFQGEGSPAPLPLGSDASRPVVLPEPEPRIPYGKPADSSLESAIGTRWIGRIGVIAILFGVAFFLKYSFDNRLIGETGRVMLGIFWGAAFIGIGEYLQKKRNMGLYGQMLSGGGLAVLYLALYAGFALYHLIPAPLASVGMLAVTTTGMTLSIRYSTYSLAAIALLGGFLTPVMLSTGQNQPLTLFGYVLLLDAGTLLLLRFRRWPTLAAASLFGTVLLYAGWHSEFFSDPQRWLAFGVVATFFVFYNLYILISRLYSQDTESKVDQFLIFGSAAFLFLAFFAQHHGHSDWPVKACALALAGVEIGMAALVRARASDARLTIAAYGAASVIMTVIATFVALEQRWLMPALAAEMAALGWMASRLDLPELRHGAYLLGLAVLFRFADDLILYIEPFERFIPVFNSRFWVCTAAIAGFYVLLYFTARNRDERGLYGGRHAPAIIFVITQALSLMLLSTEVHDFFGFRSPGRNLRWGSSHYAYQLSLSVLWALYASLLTGVGIFKRIRGARIMGILLLGATVLKVFWMDLSALQTFYRIVSFIVLGLLLLVVSYGYNRFKHIIFGEDEP
ncbi:MAG: DUF2339 domain-containing protein [Deltaproteobacteria bacterium]|nr:DUF2339 domain-containing protein [Deltaproteobacteria bacterium]